MATSFPSGLDSLTNPTSSDSLNSPSHAGQHADANDAIEALQVKVGVDSSADTNSLDYKVAQSATLTDTQTLTNKTLTSPVVDYPLLHSSFEKWTYTNQTISGTESLSVIGSSAYYNYTTASGNHTVNIQGSNSDALEPLLAVGSSVTCVWVVTNGATPRYVTGVLVDGVSQTVKWQNGSAPTAGHANSVDVYVFTVLKTAAAPSASYIVLGSLTQFA